MSKSDGVHEEGGVCARCGGLVFDPVLPQKKQEWVGLTEQEQGAIMEDLNAHGTNLYHFAKAIEAKLREKNSL